MPAHTPIGIDISENALIAAQLKKRGKAWAIQHAASRPLPHGVVVDGEVNDVDALAAALRAFISEEKGFAGKTVTLGLANQRCVVRTLSLPRMKKKQSQRSAIELEVQDVLPIPLEEAVWDYHTIGEYLDPETGSAFERHVVVMAYKESVERFVESVTRAGLKLHNIDIAAFGLLRAGAPGARAGIASAGLAMPGEQPVTAFVSIGPQSSNVVIERDGVCELNRIASVGTGMLADALVEQFGWTKEDADRVVGEAGITPLGGVESPGDPYTDARAVLQAAADRVGYDLRSSLDYFHQQASDGAMVRAVVLAGQGSTLRGLEQRLAGQLDVPVMILDVSPFVEAGSIQRIGANHAVYGTAIGLCMEDAA